VIVSGLPTGAALLRHTHWPFASGDCTVQSGVVVDPLFATIATLPVGVPIEFAVALVTVTEYVTFRDNIVSGAAHGLLINAAETGRRGAALPPKANHIRIDNVLFDDIGTPQWGSEGGKLFRIFGGVSDVSITHVTSRTNHNGILDAGDATDHNPGLTFKYNIVERLNYGIGAGGDEGMRTLDRNFSPYTYDQNVLVNTSASGSQAISDSALLAMYPAKTTVVSDWADVGFKAGTSELSSTSRFARAAADGADLGADVRSLTQAQRGRAGDGCGGLAVPRR